MNTLDQAPLLSVIVPTFNSKEFLGHCLNSILSQSYSNLEVVLVDDGSTDGSDEIYEPMQQADARLTVLRQENQGRLVARINGLRASTGRYVTFVDSDDWIDSDMYAKLISVALASGSDIAEAQFSYDYPDRSHIWTKCLPPGEYSREELKDILYPYLLHHPKLGYGLWRSSIAIKVFRRNIIEESCRLVEDQSLQMGEDLVVSTIALLLSQKITVVAGPPYYHYRQHAAQSVRLYRPTLLKDFKSLIANLRRIAVEFNEPSMVPSLYVRYIECLKDVLTQELLYNHKGLFAFLRFVDETLDDPLAVDAAKNLGPLYQSEIAPSPLNRVDKLVYRCLIKGNRTGLVAVLYARRWSILIKRRLSGQAVK